MLASMWLHSIREMATIAVYNSNCYAVDDPDTKVSGKRAASDRSEMSEGM